MIKKFISYYKPVRGVFIADLICAFLVALCDLMYPTITRNIINDYVPNQQFKLLIIWLVALGLIYVVKAGLNYFITYYGHVMGVKMQINMRRDIFMHLQKLPFSYFDENKTGTIMSRVINDLMEISELAHHGPEDLFISFIMLIGSFIILCTINLPLTLLIFTLIPVLVWFSMKQRIRLSNAFMETRKAVGEVNANLENSISGIRVSKAFNNNDYEVEKFQKGNNTFGVAREKAYKVMADFHTGTSFIMDFLTIVALAGGGVFFFKGVINFGDFTAFLLYIGMFSSPIRRLIAFIEQYQSGMTGFKRFIEIIEENPEIEDPDSKDIGVLQGDIKFEKVSFSYDENKNILSNLNLSIKKGRTVALVGPSGGGKTTLCHLIPRFYEINSGEISIDGMDIRKMTRASLRSNIGIVQQEVFLFTGTIYENILYGNVDATDEEVIAAAKKANIHDYIMSLDDGYDTYIGERGVKLSGGQKQRISIARVFLKNPPILILDEATSALDNATELLIQKSLEDLCKGRTTIVVAHRLSTIKNADEIIVFGNEGILERGTHDELIQLNSVYSELYNSQFRN